MTYNETLEYLYSLKAKGIKLGLDRVERLLYLLGNPHKKLKAIHIAGTNGKGSVSAMIYNVLKCQGYKVGLFTSPHIVDFRERIRINDELISKDDIISYTEKIKQYEEETSATFFEINTAMAFLYFADNNVDYAVIETGMGGRLDATNLLSPMLSIITNIDYDHTKTLGDTLDKIAFEKAGIIKENIPVITGTKDTSALDVIRNVSQQRNARLYEVDDYITVSNIILTAEGSYFEYRISNNRMTNDEQSNNRMTNDEQSNDEQLNNRMTNDEQSNDEQSNNRMTNKEQSKILNSEFYILHSLFLSLRGAYQIENVKIVLLALEILKQKGINITDSAVKEGLATVRWRGRLDKISNFQIPISKNLSSLVPRPSSLVVDVSHNPAGVRTLVESVPKLFSYKRIVAVVGILADKNYPKMIEMLATIIDYWLITQPKEERASTCEELKTEVCKYTNNYELYPEVADAVKRSFELADDNDMILITGSFYTVGEALQSLGYEVVV